MTAESQLGAAAHFLDMQVAQSSLQVELQSSCEQRMQGRSRIALNFNRPWFHTLA